jgi:hypothetical protein
MASPSVWFLTMKQFWRFCFLPSVRPRIAHRSSPRLVCNATNAENEFVLRNLSSYACKAGTTLSDCCNSSMRLGKLARTLREHWLRNTARTRDAVAINYGVSECLDPVTTGQMNQPFPSLIPQAELPSHVVLVYLHSVGSSLKFIHTKIVTTCQSETIWQSQFNQSPGLGDSFHSTPQDCTPGQNTES